MSASKEEMCLNALVNIARDMYEQMKEGKVPELKISTRTKHNIEYSEESEVWVYGNRKSIRSATS